MNVIIIAALALIVLVVLAVVFMGRMGLWGTEIDTCENNGGRCVADQAACEALGPYTSIKSGDSYACGENQVCCVGIATNQQT